MSSKVYMTKEISPKSLINIYQALGKQASGKVAVKISTGERGGHNFLKPELIKDLVQIINGTIVECNTAYGGKRGTSEDHRETIKEHGFLDIAPVDIMDEEGEFQIPVKDTTHIKYNLVGTHLKNYNFMINLAHFKGHIMSGFGGVIKNQSIGVASANGKAYIHTAGTRNQVKGIRRHIPKDRDKAPENNNPFTESMAAAAQSVADYFGKNILYINVMNNISIDCDCEALPAKPELNDIGILSSLDPVALDQACVDLIYNHHNEEGNNAEDLVERIKLRNGDHILEYAEEIGLGSRDYELVNID